MSQTNTPMKKPIVLRVIFILNALMAILPFIFYYVVTSKNIDTGIEPMLMIYTGIGYIVSFIALVTSILKKKFVIFRIIFFLNVLIAIPAQAYIGVLVAIISILISLNGKIKTFFKR